MPRWLQAAQAASGVQSPKRAASSGYGVNVDVNVNVGAEGTPTTLTPSYFLGCNEEKKEMALD